MRAVIFSGAGLSKESGIPTFRDSLDGLWENFDIEDVATPGGWTKDKKTVLDFYAARWQNVQDCEPNAAHKAIARLQKKYDVVNITQNIDDLLERAGCEKVWHLHGQINARKCEDYGCNYRARHEKPVELGDMCPVCGSHCRPDVVWFEENVDMQDEVVDRFVKTADVFIGVGTSAQVYPAAGLLYKFRTCPKKYFIDPNPPLRLQSFVLLQGTASEHLPNLVEELLTEA